MSDFGSTNFPPPPPPPLPASAQRRPRILARWALLALIPFLLLEFFFGWPAARERFEQVSVAIPSFIASIIFAVLFSMLCAWIAYRISSRSQLNGSIVFVAMIL